MYEISNFNAALAQVLRARREQARMTQMRLAVEIGGSEVAVRRLERGVQTPTVTTLILLARALGIEPEAFLTEVLRQAAFLDSQQGGAQSAARP
ncbi:MAG: helix-turn-helix domain-containing protein [Desulfovibrionaceae bacterium]|nr:helix-turn-helix domain-containing protein [Desulfovibrionaceae bacterium]